VGTTGELHTLNTLSITDVAWRENLGWRSPDLHRLEDQLLIPLMGHEPVEMGMSEELLLERLADAELYPPLFEAAYPGQALTLENAGAAIAAYERTFVSGTSPYDRHLQGTEPMGAAAQRGLALFESQQLKCSRCHGGFFLDSPTNAAGDVTARHSYANVGRYDIDGAGTYPNDEQGLFEATAAPTDTGAFRVPSLRNAARSGPWGHDGTLRTLDDLLTAYARGGRHVKSGPVPGDGALNPYKSELLTGFELSDVDRADLLAFLEALVDEEMLSDPLYATPFCLEEDGEVVNAPCVPGWEAPRQ